MAVFDRELQRIVLRIVYDGPAQAGKTTNLVQLHRFFTSLRRGELVSHAERAGRTLFFDWLHVDGGLVGGYPLRCQLTSVPGQAVLAHRRRLLLAAADAVVFVCESSHDGVEIGRRMAADLPRAEPAAAARVSVVVQANKQDRDGCLEPEALPALLGLAPGTPSLPARAHEGVGVRETLVLAIRAAANHVQRHILEHGLDSLSGTAETPESLLVRLNAEPPIHATAAGSTLDALGARGPQASAAPAASAEAASARPETRRVTVPAAVPATSRPPEPAVREPAADSAPSEPASDPNPLPAPVLVSAPSPTPGADAPEPVPAAATVAVAVPPPAPTSAPPTRTVDVVPATAAAPTVATPNEPDGLTLPGPDVPLGYVWPAALGRAVLRDLDRRSARQRDDLVGRHGTSDGSGRSDVLIFEAGDLCLKTSLRRRFADAESGRAAMLHLARRKTLLDTLLPPRTVLCLQPESAGGAVWLWTVSPWVTTLRTWMARAVHEGDEAALQVALEAFARAAVDALVLAARAGVVLDVHPSNFAVADGRVVYLDDDVATGERLPAIGHVLLRRVEEYASFPRCTAAYVATLQQALGARLAPEEAEQLRLKQALAEALVRGEASEAAQASLVGCVERLGAPRPA
jgi:hypothetical protein